MPASDQNINPERYQIIPRVLVFARRGESLLLMKIAGKGRWAGRYNGLGGHIERGESALAAARRELMEEAGLEADLRLAGMLWVDTGQSPGIGIFIFTGEAGPGQARSSEEGQVGWFTPVEVAGLPVLEDVPILLEKMDSLAPGAPPFSARSFYDAEGNLRVVFD
jgi:8-oxo-dGTP diphosphatase